jgi:pimeloyl-ACP methyl ester carboxylesterase
MPAVTMRWHVYAVDLRGHGKSGHKTGHYTLRDYTRDLRAFIKTVINRPTVLFGHSLGGMLATMLAADNPEIRALVIGDSPPNYDGSLRHGMIERMSYWRQAKETAEAGNTVPEIMEALKEKKLMWGDVAIEDPIFLLNTAMNWSRMDPDILTNMIECKDDPSRFVEMVEGYDTELLFPRLRCPVLLLRGNPELGGAIRDEHVDRARELIPDLTYAYFESLGHALFPVGAEPALTAVSVFLESLRS